MQDKEEVDYSMQSLAKIFSTHVEQSKIMNKIASDRWVEDNPEVPIPDYLQDGYFNLSKALSVMAQAIKDLQDKSSA